MNDCMAAMALTQTAQGDGLIADLLVQAEGANPALFIADAIALKRAI
jgi:hypothetical protein